MKFFSSSSKGTLFLVCCSLSHHLLSGLFVVGLLLSGQLFTACRGIMPQNQYYPDNEFNTDSDDTVPELVVFSPDTEDMNTDDNISKTTFDRIVNVTFSDDAGAIVNGTGANQKVTVDGNDVVITNEGSESVKYILSGSTSDGFFKLYSQKKQAIVLRAADITNKSGSALNNQSKKRTFIVLEGDNSLADGNVNSNGDYPDQGGLDEDMKAALFSEGQIIFSGSGSLKITAKGKAGITSDDYVRFMSGPTVSVTSNLGHGIRGKDAVIVSGGTVNVEVSGTGKKGFSSDSLVYIGGGATTINVHGSAGTIDGELTGAAGIKADKYFVIDDGSLSICADGKGCKGISCDQDGFMMGGTAVITVKGSDYGSSSSSYSPFGGFQGYGSDNSVSSKAVKFDGSLYFSGSDVTVNCAANEGVEAKKYIVIQGGKLSSQAYDDAVNSGSTMVINDGYVFARGIKNDGLDSNGNLYITGGTVYAVGSGSPEVAIDANTEKNYRFYFSGGSLIAIGGIESGSSLSQAIVSTSWSKDSVCSLSNGDESVLVFKTPSSGGTGLYMSFPGISNGGNYNFATGVTVNGGTRVFDLLWSGAGISGGSVSSLNASTNVAGSGSGGGTGGGPGGPGGGPGRFW